MDPVIVAAGTTDFGMFVDASIRRLAQVAIGAALDGSGLDPADITMVVLGNAAAGLLTGQEMIRAHTSLAGTSLAGVSTLSIENACASGSSAFHVAVSAVRAGMHDLVAVVGVEKMTDTDRTRARRALATAVDLEEGPYAGSDVSRPVFMEIYAESARRYQEISGATPADFAAVAAKATRLGSLNPVAQVKTALDSEQILQARTIAPPLTRPMCSSIGDGAAVVVVASEDFARRRGIAGVRVRASVLGAGHVAKDNLVQQTALAAFTQASIEPTDLDVVEVHDAAAPAELIIAEQLGLAAPGSGVALIRSGDSDLGGKCPINPSGGLLARGHPIGATGVAQLVELVNQLLGRAGPRQVDGARLALAQNAGGELGNGPAACVVTVLEGQS